MPASTRFLTPNPPVLFSPPTKHLASGSTNSFSSSSSSSNSRSANYFERSSRASAASAYLTDLTPPITPSNSNLEVESKDGNFPRVLESSDCVKKSYPLLRPMVLSEEDGGYRSDIDAVTTSAKPGIAVAKSKRSSGQRALRPINHLQEYEDSDSDDMDVDVPLLKESDDLSAVGGSEVSDDEVEREYFDEENFSRDFDCAMELIYQEAMNGTSSTCFLGEDQSTTSISPQMDLLGDESDIQIPAKPIIRALEVDSDCSPLSLCDDPSFESISQSLLSPIHPGPLPMSPAIYDPPHHGSSPLSSPYMAISTLRFGARGERRSFPPVDLTGENLDMASLIRLELATTNNAVHPNLQHQMGLGFHMPPQSRLPPSPFISYPSLQSLENEMDRISPFALSPPSIQLNPSPVQDQNQTSVESEDFMRVSGVPPSPLPVDRDQALVGLGLGAVTDGCLRSSNSITKLDSLEQRSIVTSHANICTTDVDLDTQHCAPCLDDIEGCLNTEIEPSGVLSGLESLQFHPSHASTFNPEVQLALASYQVDLGDNVDQVSVDKNNSFALDNIAVTVSVESEPERNALSDSMPRTDVFSGFIASGRRRSMKSHKDLSPRDCAREDDTRCSTPLIVKAPTLTGQQASSSYLPDAIPITPDPTNAHSTSTLAENGTFAEPSTPTEAHLAPWTDDTPRQSIEHPSLLFQDSPLRRLAQALESDGFLERLGKSPPPTASSSGPGPFPLTASPNNDPRSPCSPSMEYFHPQSYIHGCLGVLPSRSSSGGENTLPSSSSRPHSAAFPSLSGLLWESKSFEGLGLGFPSDLVSGALRHLGDHSDPMSTPEDGEDIARLAGGSVSSPDARTPNSTSPHVLFHVPTFAKRQLYVIQEQPTPSSTFSAMRSRSPSPGRRPSKSSWSVSSLLSRGVFPSSRFTCRPFSSKKKGLSDGGSPSSLNGHDGLARAGFEEGGASPPSTTKPTRFFRRIFRQIVGPRRSDSTPSASSLSGDNVTAVQSPGVIVHPDAPRGPNIITRRWRGRHNRAGKNFQVLF